MKHQETIRQMSLMEKCCLLSGKDTWSTRPVEHAGVPSMVLSDGPSGLRRQLGAGDQLGLNESVKATCFPSSATIANAWDEALAEKVGTALGCEASSLEVDVLLGPGLNVKRSPLCGRNFEYYSEDPYLAGKMAAGLIRGVQSQGVSACPKHFAANSQELHRMASDSVLDERAFRELYMTNFEIAVKEGHPRSIMSAYNAINGVYANENAHLLQEILRDEWGFDGMVVTDWGGCNDFIEGLRSGSNLEMPGTSYDSPSQLMKSVQEGKISEDEVDRRVDELLDVILWTAQRKKQTIDAEKQNSVALEAAEKAIVLLKNDENILPLDKQEKIALIGDFADMPRYQGAGSSMVNTANLTKTMEILKEYFPANIGFAKGFTRADKWDEALAAEAIELAKKAETVVMYMGLPEVFEAEGLDRSKMTMPGNQIRLLNEIAKVNKRIVVVFSAGSAVEMNWLGDCQALLWAGLGGQAGAKAVLEALCGDVNPGGKLAETFVARYNDLPVSKYYPGEGRLCLYKEGMFAGYRFTETANAEVSFPFGFGMSYTTFEYTNIEASETSVSFDITNTGNRAGDEIAQVYVTLPGGKVLRPAKELKGFARVTLAPGETKRVSVALDDKAFRYFNTATNRFEVEGGKWQVMVGASVRDIRLTAEAMVKGSDASVPESATFKPNDLMNVTDAEFEKMLGHAIPTENKERKRTLTMNDPMDALVNAKNPVARLVMKVILHMRAKSIAAGKPDLNILFITNMPFRGMAKMTGGMLSMQMAEDLVFLCNGHWHRGLGRVIRDFFKKPNEKSMMEGKDK